MLNLISKILCQNNSGLIRKMSWGLFGCCFGWFYVLVWFFSVVFFGFGPFSWGEMNEYIERNFCKPPHFNETESKQWLTNPRFRWVVKFYFY